MKGSGLGKFRGKLRKASRSLKESFEEFLLGLLNGFKLHQGSGFRVQGLGFRVKG